MLRDWLGMINPHKVLIERFGAKPYNHALQIALDQKQRTALMQIAWKSGPRVATRTDFHTCADALYEAYIKGDVRA